MIGLPWVHIFILASVSFNVFTVNPVISLSIGSSNSRRSNHQRGSPTIMQSQQHQQQKARTESSRSFASASSSNSLNDLQDAPSLQSIRVGFIGCGTIASAIAFGFAKQTKISIQHITVSKRSASKSAALQEKLGTELVFIYENNQQVVDQSDLVFITVLPQQTTQVLQSLTFDASKHTLISLVSTSRVDQLAIDSKLPLGRVFKMICLPAVATLDGVCLITPNPVLRAADGNDDSATRQLAQQNSTLTQLFESLGGMISADTEEQMTAMMIPSGMMGTFYGVLKQHRDFVLRQANGAESQSDSNHQRLGSRAATELVIKYYHGMLVDAMQRLEQEDNANDNSDLLEQLIEEQTPGGLNEQCLNEFQSLNGMDVYTQVQESLLKRLTAVQSNGANRNDP
ncbi:hypothetical protein MPSEU_000631100 [Mayamaea pseudoterrestris]|nr:hypothetical protein MPSEU_000631100 [Mayamaea pseudoterrestris]